MAALARDGGVALRPHAKTHKSPVIARKQLALGAVGICTAKIGEAEVMVANGIDNVLITTEPVPRNMDRFIALAARRRYRSRSTTPTSPPSSAGAPRRGGSRSRPSST